MEGKRKGVREEWESHYFKDREKTMKDVMGVKIKSFKLFRRIDVQKKDKMVAHNLESYLSSQLNFHLVSAGWTLDSVVNQPISSDEYFKQLASNLHLNQALKSLTFLFLTA